MRITMAYQTPQPTFFKRVLSSHFFQAGLVVAIILFSGQVWHQYKTMLDVAERRHSFEIEHQQLQTQREILANRVDSMSDDFGIEAEIRRHFDVAQAGEQVVIIIDDAPIELPPPTPAVQPVSRPWWKFWQ